jgi:hypothetical protein
MKNYISITIGRNNGEEEMSDLSWSLFCSAVRKALTMTATVEGIVFEGMGAGVWGSLAEPAHCLIALCDHVNTPALRAELARIAKIYDQDAIGLVIHTLPNGNESLVYAQK